MIRAFKKRKLWKIRRARRNSLNKSNIGKAEHKTRRKGAYTYKNVMMTVEES